MLILWTVWAFSRVSRSFVCSLVRSSTLTPSLSPGYRCSHAHSYNVVDRLNGDVRRNLLRTIVVTFIFCFHFRLLKTCRVNKYRTMSIASSKTSSVVQIMAGDWAVLSLDTTGRLPLYLWWSDERHTHAQPWCFIEKRANCSIYLHPECCPRNFSTFVGEQRLHDET